MSHSARIAIAIVAIAGSLTTSLIVTAEGPSAASAVDGQAAATAAALARQLDDPQFARREMASRELEPLGAAAVDALSRVAQRGTAEASRRAFALLEKFVHGQDAVAREAATTALRTIAESDRADLAKRASEILMPEKSTKPRRLRELPEGFPPLFGGEGLDRPAGEALLRGLRLIPDGGKFGGMTSTTIVRNNGKLQATIQERGRTIKIDEDPETGITIEIIEGAAPPPTNGRVPEEGEAEPPAAPEEADARKTTKITAKDVAELKAKHPEAHELYERHLSNEGLGIPDDLFGEDGFPNFPEGFPNFDDDFFRGFEEALPPEFRRMRPQAPEGQNPRDIQRDLQRRLQQLRQELRRLRQQREDPAREDAPEGEEPPAEQPQPGPKSVDESKTIEV